jgi:antitoxin CptB
MTGTTISSAALDPHRRKILFRAWHRGLREMDLLLGSFADAWVARLEETELRDFERLLESPDRDVLDWLTEARPVPETFETPVFAKLRQFHSHARPLHI